MMGPSMVAFNLLQVLLLPILLWQCDTLVQASGPSVTFHPDGADSQGVQVMGTPSPGDIDIFFGIPFAEPPLGKLRFKPPQPVSTWPEVINSTGYRDGCMQAPSEGHQFSEDCLYLNIWRPQGYDENSKLPVLVFLYGGSFLGGYASAFNYTNLVQQSVMRGQPIMVVSTNYRLGPFGFGYGKEYLDNGAANSGLWDVVATLDWVQQNIGSFGGDCDKVSIGGQSAGAVAASLMPLIKTPPKLSGIFLNSGSPAANPLAPTVDGYPGVYPLLLNYTGCTNSQNTFECLRDVDAEILNNATQKIRAMDAYKVGFPWNPNVDYDLIPDRPSTLLKDGRFAQIPVMAGSDLDEGTNFIDIETNTTEQVALQVDYLEPVPPTNDTLDRLLELYPDDPALGSPYDTGNETFGLGAQYKRIASLYGDLAFQHARRWMMEQFNANGWCKTWTWLFDATNHPESRAGISHVFDTQYFFGQVREEAFGQGGVALSSLTLQYWLNFIYYSDPNGANPGEIIYWPAYFENGADANMLKFTGDNSTFNASVIQDDYRKEQIDFVNQHPVDFNS